MKTSSKILGILTVLIAIAILISTVNAADVLNNNDFAIKAPSGSNFTEIFNTDIDVSNVAMKIRVFENSGNNSDDVNTIIYLKDDSTDNNVISSFIKDLKVDGDVIEENNRYVVIKTQNSNNLNFFDSDISGNLDVISDFFEGIFSSDNSLNITFEDNAISFTNNGLEILDANGTNVSISKDGIEVSDGASSDGGEYYSESNISVGGDVSSNIQNGNYALYLKDQNKNQAIVLVGNNLESLKAMADTN